MRKHITEEMLRELNEGRTVDMKLSPKRTLTLDPKSDKERALERLEAKYEADKAKIVGKEETD